MLAVTSDRIAIIGVLAASVFVGCSTPSGLAVETNGTANNRQAGDGEPPGPCANADLMSDGLNCGRCGRSCGGAACSMGRCPVTTLYLSQRPYGIAVQGKNVFWTSVGSGLDGSVHKGTTTGGDVSSPIKSGLAYA